MQRRAEDIMTVIRRSVPRTRPSFPDLKGHCARAKSDAESSTMRPYANLDRDPYAKEYLWRQCLFESSCPEPRDALKACVRVS